MNGSYSPRGPLQGRHRKGTTALPSLPRTSEIERRRMQLPNQLSQFPASREHIASAVPLSRLLGDGDTAGFNSYSENATSEFCFLSRPVCRRTLGSQTCQSFGQSLSGRWGYSVVWTVINCLQVCAVIHGLTITSFCLVQWTPVTGNWGYSASITNTM